VSTETQTTPAPASKTTTALTVVSAAISEFNKVAQGLAELTKQYKGVVYPVATPQGMAAAKAARTAIRRPRYDIERIRKEAKAPILTLGRELDGEAARIRDEILAIENPIDEQITNEEQRKENERLAKIETERKRVEDIQNRITAIRNWPADAVGKPASVVEQRLQAATEFTVGEDFGEWATNARAALESSRVALSGILSERIAYEAEQARIIAEREELTRLRAEQEERDRRETARRTKEERKAEAERAALAAQQEAELRRQREEQARLDAEAKARREAEEAEHRERMRAQQAEIDRVAREQQAARDAEIAAENERLRLQREESERKEHELQAAQQRNEAAMQELQAINHQLMIADTGRAPYIKGRTREGIETLIGETKAWPITEEKFGALTQAARAARETTLAGLRQKLREIEEQEARAAQDARKAEQARLASIKRPNDDEMIGVLAAHYSVPATKVVEWLSTLKVAADVPPRARRSKVASA